MTLQRVQKQSFPTSRRSELVLGGFFANFEPIMEGFKAQTLGIEGGRFGDIFWSFLKVKKPSLRVETP